MLTKDQINQLKKRVKLGDVFWKDSDGVCHRVRGVNLKWVEFADEPKLHEPAALLEGGGAVALHNVELSTFVTTMPLALGDGYTPTTYVERLTDALALLCGGNRPDEALVIDYFDDDGFELQDWAINHTSLPWTTGIGVIEAAMALAETPIEGIGEGRGPEHQTREEAFPRPEQPEADSETQEN